MVDPDGATGSASPLIEKFVYDGQELYLQFDGSDTLTHRYIHGPAVDQVLLDEDFTQMVGENSGDPAFEQCRWTLPDHEGSVRDIVDGQNQLLSHKAYDSFGRVTSETNTAAAADVIFGYTGRQFDADIGLEYDLARFYDPNTGRFISTDPTGFGGGDYNLYRYTGNSPHLHTDPSGLRMFSGPAMWDGMDTINGLMADADKQFQFQQQQQEYQQ